MVKSGLREKEKILKLLGDGEELIWSSAAAVLGF
jgi:hypothetical protein